MAYLVNKTDGTLLATVLDGQTDTFSSSITLLGKQVTNYGELQNENFIHILENFASTVDPAHPLEGQLWWDSNSNVLKLYDGDRWRPVTGFSVNLTAPTNSYTGDQWWDTTNDQFKIWSGSEWILVGPAYSKLDAKNGALVEPVWDTSLNRHLVILLYQNGVPTAIISRDTEFTPNVAVTGFTTASGNIAPGINLNTNITDTRFTGTATNADLLDNLDSTQFLRRDINATHTANVTIQGNLLIGTVPTLTINTTSSDTVVIKNNISNANVDVKVNNGGNTVNGLSISGIDGLVTLYSAPTAALHAATKGYVDSSVSSASGSANSAIDANISAVNLALDGLRANITAANLVIQDHHVVKANLRSPQFLDTPTATTQAHNTNSNALATTAFVRMELGYYSDSNQLAANVDTLNGQLRSALQNNVNTINTAISGLRSNITAANSAISSLDTFKAPKASPALTGEPTAPTASHGTISTQIATTAFVRNELGYYSDSDQLAANIGTLNGDLRSAIQTNVTTINTAITVVTNKINAANVNIDSLDTLKAPKASPTFTGVAKAPTVPSPSEGGPLDGNIATTYYVYKYVNESVDQSALQVTSLGAGSRTTSVRVWDEVSSAGVKFFKYGEQVLGAVAIMRMLVGLGAADAGETALRAIMNTTNPTTGRPYGAVSGAWDGSYTLSDAIVILKQVAGQTISQAESTAVSALLTQINSSPSLPTILAYKYVQQTVPTDAPSTKFVRVTVDTSNKFDFTSAGLALSSTKNADDNSTFAATTAYVDRARKNATLNNGALYQPTIRISSAYPDDDVGNNGDIWIQYTT